MTLQTQPNEYIKSGEPVDYFMFDVEVSLADTAATDDRLVEGDGFAFVTFDQPKPALTETEYPVLAAIWDNDDDAEAFDSL